MALTETAAPGAPPLERAHQVALLTKRITRLQFRKQMEVPVARQQLINAMTQADGCNPCVMDNATADSTSAQDRIQQLMEPGRFTERPDGWRAKPCLNLVPRLVRSACR